MLSLFRVLLISALSLPFLLTAEEHCKGTLQQDLNLPSSGVLEEIPLTGDCVSPDANALIVQRTGIYIAISETAFEWEGKSPMRGAYLRRNGVLLAEQQQYGQAGDPEYASVQVVWAGRLEIGDRIDFRVWTSPDVPVRLSARCLNTWITLTLVKGEGKK